METFGKYRFDEKLGDGSFGTAYLAYDASRDHPVVIRTVGPGIQWDESLRERFVAESTVLRGLKHPNIAVVHEYGEKGGIAYIVMEYLPGADLKKLISERTPMALEQKLSIMNQVASGLSFAHNHAVLHRNLRPGTIHVLPDGTVKVADLSIPAMLSVTPGDGAGPAHPGLYLAPEQLQGGEPTAQSDIFSLGIILYEFLTGIHPFHDDDAGSIPDKIMHQGHYPTLERFSELPLSLWPVLSKCLAKDASERYLNMAEFGTACRGLLDELAEDSQLMRIELQSALPGLRKAARGAGAPPEAAELLANIESALNGKAGSDYLRLNRLVGAMIQQSHMRHSAVEPPVSSPHPAVAESAARNPEVSLHEERVEPESPVRIDTAHDRHEGAEEAPAFQEAMEDSDFSLPERMEFEAREPDSPFLEPEESTGSCTESPTSPSGPNGERAPEDFFATEYSVIEQMPATSARRELRKMVLWMCAAALALTMALAVPYLIRPRTVPWGSRRPPGTALTGGSAGTSGEDSSPDSATHADARRDILLEEAQALHSLGRLDESAVFLKRLLEGYPAYEPAVQELRQIEKESAPLKKQSSSSSIQKLVAGASSALQAGNFAKAQADLDRAEKLEPGSPDVAAVRRRLAAKTSELALSLSREQEKQQQALNQKTAEIAALRAGELFRQGKYSEAIAFVDEQQAQHGSFPRTEDLRAKAVEVQNSMNAYEAAMSAARHTEALAALSQVERLNPADPRLPALRNRAEAALSPGNAVLSVYPLAEAATLIFDGTAVGTDGEIVRQSIAAGKHKLSVKNDKGREVSLDCNFSNGQEISLVYDMTRSLLRPMTEADRELMASNQAKQQVHSFAVEHTHGFLRGSCKGELTVTYYDVTYKPETGSHRFSLPFKALKLRIENRTAVLLFATDDKEFETFRMEDTAAALALKKFWDELAALNR